MFDKFIMNKYNILREIIPFMIEIEPNSLNYGIEPVYDGFDINQKKGVEKMIEELKAKKAELEAKKAELEAKGIDVAAVDEATANYRADLVAKAEAEHNAAIAKLNDNIAFLDGFIADEEAKNATEEHVAE